MAYTVALFVCVCVCVCVWGGGLDKEQSLQKKGGYIRQIAH